MDKQEADGLEEQLKSEIPEDKPTTINLTLKGKGEAGQKEVDTLLNTLRRLRLVSNEIKTSNNGELVVSLDITREKRTKKTQETPTIDEYATQDGMLLTLTQNRDGQIEVKLEEDTKIPDSREKIRYIQRIVETFADVDRKNIMFAPLPENSDAEKKIVTMRIKDVKKLTSIEQETLAEKALYHTMRQTLQQKIEEMEQQKRSLPQTTLDYIEFWTHLTVGSIYHREYTKSTKGSTPNFYTITEKLAAEKELLKVADFLRELYGLVKIRTTAENAKDSKKRIVTMGDIHSDFKSRETVRERHVMMYIIKNRFPFLSSTALGEMFGELGNPKNHATVLLGTSTTSGKSCPKQFDENIGIKPLDYGNKDKTAEILYADALLKFDKAHRYY